MSIKVYVVHTKKGVIGVFSDEQESMDYCDRVDPRNVTHFTNVYEIDKLVPDGPEIP